MPVQNHPEYDAHEEVVFFDEPSASLKAIVAIHNTRRGPALGGVRMYPYTSEDDALTDVLRLSKGMTYKAAISGLPLGGGKAVIIGDPQNDKSVELFEAFGRCMERLGGRYIVAEDSGTTVQDLRIIARQTAHVSGVAERRTANGEIVDCDPSPATAYGVLMGIRAAVKHQLGRDNLQNIKIAVQGVGSVGRRLVKHLCDAGAKVSLSDVFPERVAALAAQFPVEVLEADGIYQADVDVFSPCALGGILNDATIPQLRAAIIAGAANNQLLKPGHGGQLQTRGILYVPDYAINAGGVIDIAAHYAGLSYEQSMAKVAGIYDTVSAVLQRAADEKTQPEIIANRMAEENFL